MKLVLIILFSLILPVTLSAENFVSAFMDKYAEDERPLNNVNIGKAMLDKMAANIEDEEMKTALKDLRSIRIINTENQDDSNYYFKKANELIKESFDNYEEAVSLSDTGSKISVWVKRLNEEKQELILISLDEEGKLSIISVSGRIDFNSISKLSGMLRIGQDYPANSVEKQ